MIVAASPKFPRAQVKEHFSEVTQEQVKDFSAECKELLLGSL